MSVTYDYYRIFYYVARYKSFTRAANVLLSNQPNVTRAMNNLEQQLGCRLFVRSHRGVALTPEGELLFAHVQVAQEQLQTAEQELARGRSLQSGSVSVGANETALHGPMLPVLRRFRHTYPGVRIRITHHSTPGAVEAVRRGLVELAVVTTPTGAAKPLRETLLNEFDEVLIAGPAYARLTGRTLHLRELKPYPLVFLGRATKTYELYNDLFVQNGLELQPDIEAATTDQILSMVQNDLGLGFLPRAFVQEALQNGSVLELTLAEPLPTRRICLVKDERRPLSIAALELERMLRQAAAEA